MKTRRRKKFKWPSPKPNNQNLDQRQSESLDNQASHVYNCFVLWFRSHIFNRIERFPPSPYKTLGGKQHSFTWHKVNIYWSVVGTVAMFWVKNPQLLKKNVSYIAHARSLHKENIFAGQTIPEVSLWYWLQIFCFLCYLNSSLSIYKLLLLHLSVDWTAIIDIFVWDERFENSYVCAGSLASGPNSDFL